MRACRLLSATVAWFALGSAFGAQEVEPRLRCVSIPTKKHSGLRLEGTAPLPDAVVLRISLYRIEERAVSGRLASTPNFLRSAYATVSRGRFSLHAEVEGPGEYLAKVDFLGEGQSPEHRNLLSGDVPRQWSFALAAWDDGLALELVPRLMEFDRLAGEARAMIQKFAEARGPDGSWKDRSPALQKEAAGLSRKLEEGPARRLYPAAIREIQSAVWSLRREGGSANYHALGQAVKTRETSEKAFDGLKKTVEEASVIAGREFALWVLKEMKRSGGSMGRELSEAVESLDKRAGIMPFAERLQKAAPEERPALEQELRAGTP